MVRLAARSRAEWGIITGERSERGNSLPIRHMTISIGVRGATVNTSPPGRRGAASSDLGEILLATTRLTPEQLDDLLALPSESSALSSMQCLIQGGAPCPEQNRAAIKARWGLEISSQPLRADNARLVV